MTKKEVQEQVTKDPHDKDPFTTKFKGTIAGFGKDRKEDDKKLKKAVSESIAMEKAIDDYLMRNRKRRSEQKHHGAD